MLNTLDFFEETPHVKRRDCGLRRHGGARDAPQFHLAVPVGLGGVLKSLAVLGFLAFGIRPDAFLS
jgi:hypothetical protein